MKRTILIIIGIVIGLLALLFTYAAESHGQSVTQAFTAYGDNP